VLRQRGRGPARRDQCQGRAAPRALAQRPDRRVARAHCHQRPRRDRQRPALRRRPAEGSSPVTPAVGTFASASESPLFNRVREKFWIRGSPPGSCGVFGSSGFSGRLRQSPRGALFVVVSGLAGAGKTEFLAGLRRDGEQVLDLEALARHRGSAFGAIGLGPQPSHAAFARAVSDRVAAAHPRRVLWVEDEGPFIGSVGVPPWLAEEIARAPIVEVRATFAARVARLNATYGAAAPQELLHALARPR